MNLKDFLASREKPPELFWSLVIEEGWVQAGIWYIGESAAEVISVSPGAAWETEDELIGAADAALSSSVQKLPEEYPEPTKTVFGVPSSWVKGGEIIEDQLARIKKICTELSLTPVGFVVLPEAIAHLYKSEEGSPVSAIILGLGKDALEISVFKLGNLVGTTTVSRSVSLIEDVTEGLSRFEGAAPLPSRFIVFDGKGGELEEAKETLMQASWEENSKIKFLHTPKAETLASDRKVLATSLAGANEIGHVSQVTSKEETEVTVEPDISEPEVAVTAEAMGFAVGTDVSLATPPPAPPPPPVPSVPAKPYLPFGTKKDYLDKIKDFFTGIFPTNLGKKPLINIGIFLGLFILVLGLFWWFYPKAKVTIFVTPKKFEQEANISFNSEGKFEKSEGILPGEILSAEVSGDKTKATSGTKTVGDKAKGSVQIQNGTAFPISLPSGTVLVSSGNLKFEMDNAASVSAALSPNSPGTATVAVTASAIGAEYNLAKDEVFKVGNYPKAEVDGTSTGDFSGGSSREISAVSKDDQTSLEDQLKVELVNNAKMELSGKITDSQFFVEDLAATDIISEKFDHKINDEADSLKLSLSLKTTAVAADKAKLLEYAREVLKDKIPSGFVLRDAQISFKFTFIDSDDTNINYKAVISANFLPEVSTEKIIKQIAGKTPEVAESYLGSIPGFSRALVTLKPRLPGPFGTLPRVQKNISIEVVAEQ